jgi:cysteine desulfurase
MIYLDYNATAPLYSELLDFYTRIQRDYWANASSFYRAGQKSRDIIQESRLKIARHFDVRYPEILFTSGGTESNYYAVLGAIRGSGEDRPHIITTAVEHSSILTLFYTLHQEGVEISILPVDSNGQIDIEELENEIKENTVLVSVMHANNETGTFMPVDKAGEICRERKVLFHVDAVQTCGKYPLNIRENKIDLLSFSGHKFQGPKGAGGLYVRDGILWKAPVEGVHQEKGRRAGTENIAGIAAMGEALEISCQFAQENLDKIKKLREKLEKGILDNIPEVKINGHPHEKMENTLNISFRYASGESILMALDAQGICASAGSACASGSISPSHVLSAMGLSPEEALGAVRFSLGPDNTEEEMDRVLEVLIPAVERIRSKSPQWKNRG